MSKFTPGPWEVARDEHGDLFVKAPASTLPVHCVCNMGLVSDAAVEPDAHLIAAAPELYEIASEACAWLEENIVGGELRERLRRVLAKARGELVSALSHRFALRSVSQEN